jgi:hypothetical protein
MNSLNYCSRAQGINLALAHVKGRSVPVTKRDPSVKEGGQRRLARIQTILAEVVDYVYLDSVTRDKDWSFQGGLYCYVISIGRHFGTNRTASPSDAAFLRYCHCNSIPVPLHFTIEAYERLQPGAIPYFVASFASLAGMALPLSSLFTEPAEAAALAGWLFGSCLTPFVSGF